MYITEILEQYSSRKPANNTTYAGLLRSLQAGRFLPASVFLYGTLLACSTGPAAQDERGRQDASVPQDASLEQRDAADVPGNFATRTPWPMGTRYIQSGHSLTDTVMAGPWPGRLTTAVLMDEQGGFEDVSKSTIPGSSIRWRWENSEWGGDQAAQWPEEIGSHQGLVITTSVPLYSDDATRQSEQVDWLRTGVMDAWQNGNNETGVPSLLYTTWTQLYADPNEPHPEDSLSFRQRLDLDNARWEAMQDFVNASRPSGAEPLFLIPGHRLMMRIHDDIEAQTSPFSAIDELFSDSIHPNATGAYAVTLLHYACIYGRDPSSFLPNTLVEEDALSAAEATYFKTIVADVVTNYPRTGLAELSTQ